MPNKISQQSVREAALPLTVWGMVHCSGRLGSKYSLGLGAAGLKEGRGGREGGATRDDWGGDSGVLAGTWDAIQYKSQIVNTEEGHTERERNRDKICLPGPSTGQRNNGPRTRGAA